MMVTYFQRRAYDNAFSVERVFSSVRHSLPPRVQSKLLVSRFTSRGLLRRLYNAIEAAVKQGSINHITGDVHYLASFLRKSSTVLTIHDCRSLHRLSGIRRQIVKLLWYDIPCRRSALITTISDFTRCELIACTECPPENIRVIPDPFDPDFSPSPHTFNGEVLTRPTLPAAWSPEPEPRPEAATSSGHFDYGRGGLPKPAHPPRPELAAEHRVALAPGPGRPARRLGPSGPTTTPPEQGGDDGQYDIPAEEP